MNENSDKLKEPPIHDVGAEKIARVYAEALLNQAQKRGQEQEILEELRSLINDVFSAHPELEEFLVHGAIGRENKAKAIESTFAGRANELLVNFLLVLNDHDRLELLRESAFRYSKLLDERLGRVRVQVRSAVALTSDQEQRLIGELRQAFRLDPVLEPAVDPELLGGLVVRVGDWVYDASVRTRLENLRNQIIESSSHEIQAGRNRFRTGTTDSSV